MGLTIAAAVLTACGKEDPSTTELDDSGTDDTGLDRGLGGTTDSGEPGESGDTGETGDTGGPVDTTCADSDAAIDSYDDDGDGLIDRLEVGENASLECINYLFADTMATDARITLTGSGIEGGLVVGSGMNWTVDVAPAEGVDTIEVEATSGDGSMASAAFYVEAGGALTVVGGEAKQLVINGSYTGVGIGAEDGSELSVSGIKIIEPYIGILSGASTMTLTDVDIVTPQNLGITYSGDYSANVNVTDVAITNAVTGFASELNEASESAMMITGADELVYHNNYVSDQHTGAQTVYLEAAYVYAAHNVLTGNIAGSEVMLVQFGGKNAADSQDYAYGVVADNAIWGNQATSEGFLTVESMGLFGTENIKVDNNTIAGNSGIVSDEGTHQAVNHALTANGQGGQVVVGQNIIANNSDVVGSTISRVVDGDGGATVYEKVEHNALFNNGDGDERFEDVDGTNFTYYDPQLGDTFYSRDSGVFIPGDVFPQNAAVQNIGGIEGLYPNASDPSVAGTPGVGGGMLGAGICDTLNDMNQAVYGTEYEGCPVE
jgi:hypothetical protein